MLSLFIHDADTTTSMSRLTPAVSSQQPNLAAASTTDDMDGTTEADTQASASIAPSISLLHAKITIYCYLIMVYGLI